MYWCYPYHVTVVDIWKKQNSNAYIERNMDTQCSIKSRPHGRRLLWSRFASDEMQHTWVVTLAEFESFRLYSEQGL